MLSLSDRVAVPLRGNGRDACRNVASPHRRKHHGSSETRFETPRAPQKDFESHKGIFPYQVQALKVRSGGGESRRSLFLPRSPRPQTPVPQIVDSAHWSGCAHRGHLLQPVDARPQGGGRGDRPQDALRHRGKGCRGIHATCRAGQGFAGRSKSQGVNPDCRTSTCCAPNLDAGGFPRSGRAARCADGTKTSFQASPQKLPWSFA